MGGVKYSDMRTERGDGARDEPDSSKPSRWERLKERYLRPLAKVAAAVVVSGGVAGTVACGAKTGLLVEDMRPDAGTEDAADVPDVTDVPDTTDVDAIEGTDTPDADTPESISTPVAANLIGDYLNRDMQDRDPNIPGNPAAEYAVGGSDTNENANPFTNGAGGNIGVSEGYMYKVDSSAFAPFEAFTVLDSVASVEYVENQSLWIRGDNHYDQDSNGVVGNLQFIAYQLKFDGPGRAETGIPVCTSARAGDYTACTFFGADIDDATITHKVKIRWLGSEWVLTRMNPPPGTLSGEDVLLNGGSVRLAKEAISGRINTGEALLDGDARFVFDGVEETVPGMPVLVFTAYGESSTETDRIAVPDTTEFTVDGANRLLHAYRFGPGVTAGSYWADVAVLAREIDLADGEALDHIRDTNPSYRVALGWKNSEPSAVSTAPDSLRTMIVYSDEIADIASGGEERLLPGDSVPLVKNPEVWRLSYEGLDIEDEELQPLQFEIQTTDKMISEADGPTVGPDGRKVACVIYAPYVRVRSGASGSIFSLERSDSSGEMSDDEFYIALAGKRDMDPDVDTDGLGDDVDGTRWVAAACDAHGDGIPDNALDSLGGSLTPYIDPTNSLGYARTAGDGDLGFEPGTIFMRVSPSSDEFGVYAYDSYRGLLVGTPATEVTYVTAGEAPFGFAPPAGGVILVEAGSDVVNQPMSAPAENQLSDLFSSAGAECFLFSDFSAMECGSPLYLSGEQPGGMTDRYGLRDNIPDFYFAVAEKAGTGRSNRFVNYHIFAIDGSATGNPAEATFSSDASTGTTGFRLTSSRGEVLYGHATPNTTIDWPYTNEYYGGDPVVVGPVVRGVEFVEQGYVSERGSVVGRVGSSSVEFLIAERVAKGRWVIRSGSDSGE